MRKILLVEDDAVVQRVHQMMLTKLGCQVDIAANGIIALEKAKNNADYNIIFVDIGLPDISGFDLIKQLKDVDTVKTQTIPIIALTGYAGQEERQTCLEAGAIDIAYKPIITSALRALLDRYHTIPA